MKGESSCCKQGQPLQAIQNMWAQDKDGIIDREKRESITDTCNCTCSEVEAQSRVNMQLEIYRETFVSCLATLPAAYSAEHCDILHARYVNNKTRLAEHLNEPGQPHYVKATWDLLICIIASCHLLDVFCRSCVSCLATLPARITMLGPYSNVQYNLHKLAWGPMPQVYKIIISEARD